jgi:hypothetical protein
MSCNVCCVEFTKCQRKEIICPFCQYSSCLTCNRTYLLDNINDIHCMSCKASWNISFVTSVFPKAFLYKEYKLHRENVLLDREKSRIVATIPLAEEEKQRRKDKEMCLKLKKERDAKFAEINLLNLEIWNLEHRVRDENKVGKRVFIHRCVSEGCKGYIDSEWKCGLCSVSVCSSCLCKKEDVHVCDPNDIESIKMIQKESRQCPSCSVPIMKIDGCDQMWCPECKEAFSWKSGRIEKGPIHNPHFYEYARRNGGIPRNIGDVPCGGLPTLYNLMRHMKKMGLNDHDIIDILRMLNHIQAHEIPKYPVHELGTDIYSDLRVNYILNDITEDEWKANLQKKEKKVNSNKNIRLIYDMITSVSVDLFNTVIQKSRKQEDVDIIMKEFECLRKEANKAFIQHARMFNLSLAQNLSEAWYVSSIPAQVVNKIS